MIQPPLLILISQPGVLTMPVLKLLSMASPSNSFWTNQPYRFPPTVRPMMSLGSVRIHVPRGTCVLAGSTVNVTASGPPVTPLNTWRNVYQPDVVMWTGEPYGLAPQRVALLVPLT